MSCVLLVDTQLIQGACVVDRYSRAEDNSSFPFAASQTVGSFPPFNGAAAVKIRRGEAANSWSIPIPQLLPLGHLVRIKNSVD